MLVFRVFLAGFLLVLTVYTGMVMAAHGASLIPVFFSDMAQMAWPGQFNLDFFGFLLLSGIWVAWRHHFRPAGLALALLATLGGMMFLCLYLLAISWQTRGDIKAMMLGTART
jgi:hypothetical protein